MQNAQKFLHLLFLEEIVAAVYRLVADAYLRNIAQRLASAIYKGVGRIYQISIDVAYLLRLPVLEEILFLMLRIREADDHHMDVGFEARLAIPAEGAVGEVDADALGEERLPEVGHLFALRDGIGGDEGCFHTGTFHIISGTLVPCPHIVDVAHILPFLAEDGGRDFAPVEVERPASSA